MLVKLYHKTYYVTNCIVWQTRRPLQNKIVLNTTNFTKFGHSSETCVFVLYAQEGFGLKAERLLCLLIAVCVLIWMSKVTLPYSLKSNF